jgi:hypothetical protein
MVRNLYEIIHTDQRPDWKNAFGGPVDDMLCQYVAVPADAIVPISKSTTLSWP